MQDTQKWRCTSCSAENISNRNIETCMNCHMLESDINLKRATELYILGNINQPSVDLIPLKIPFFIYPLSPPMVYASTIQYHEKELIIDLEVELWDNRHIENYHIECIKVDSYLNGSKCTIYIDNKSPYYNKFRFHMEGYQSMENQQESIIFEIYAKCYGPTYVSDRISPKQRYHVLLNSSGDIIVQYPMCDTQFDKSSNRQENEHEDEQQLLLYTRLAQLAKNNNYNNIISIDINTNQHDRYKTFKHSFVIHCLYSDQEKVKNIFEQIEIYLNTIYPMKMEIDSINDGSFVFPLDDSEILFCRKEKKPIAYNEAITVYPKENIISKGLNISVAAHVGYEHKIDSISITCEYMNRLKSDDPLKCPIYYAMIQEYDYSADNLSHLNTFIHFENEYESKPSCKYGPNCKAYIRQEIGKGGDRLDDKCHIKMYRHPPRNRFIKLSENVHPLIINKSTTENHSIYSPTYDDIKKHKFNIVDGYLKALIQEVIDNGFKYDLCLECGKEDDCKHSDYSILKIVDEKMKHIRHQQMGSLLRRDHMLSFILYTGCDCNYDLCAEQRRGNYKKWIWFDRLLYKAIEIISTYEYGDFIVYSGLKTVKMDVKKLEEGYFVTYVSTSWQKEVSEGFVREKEGMIIQIDREYKNDYSIYCCDVSWIAKFPDECEILFARSLPENNSFSCVVLDELNGVQTVSLKKRYQD